MEMLSKAIEMAEKALNGKTDQHGRPYIDHTLRVVSKMDTETEKIVAALHDVVEDGDVSLHELQDQNFSREVIDAVGMLTKRADMTYFDYIDDVSCSELATKVKIAEVEDNQDVFRVKKMSFQTYNLEDRAARTLKILRGE